MKVARPSGVILLMLLSYGLTAQLVLPVQGQEEATTIDLSVESADFTVISRDGGDELGSPNTMALGDFNGDGVTDLLLGAPGGDGPNDNRTDAGEAYILYGRPDLPPTFDVDGVPGPDVIVYGADPGDRLGSGVAAGDVNGDGIDDLILGAPGADGPANNRDSVGEVIVILGGFLDASIDLRTRRPDMVIYNNRQRSGFGTALLGLDLSGDGIEDVVIADPEARSRAGAVYAIYGRFDLPERRDIARPDEVNLTIWGRDPGDALGSALSAGDINRDGIPDLLIGAPGGDGPNNERLNGGEAYVILGNPALPRTIDLAATSADVTVFGADPHDQLGTSVAAGDINGDNVQDLIVGAPGAAGPGNRRGSSGEAYVFHGADEIPSVLDVRETPPDVVIYGAQLLENLGSAVSSADLDADGFPDLILGAKGGRGPTNDRPGAGTLYVLRNPGGLPPVVDLQADGANLIIYGAEAGDALGSSLLGANLTGILAEGGFLLTGAPGADSPGDGPDAGLIYAFRAKELIAPNQPPVANAGPDQTANVGELVLLDGSASFDPDEDPLTFQWAFISQPEGSTAALDDPTSPTPTFTPDVPGEYVLELTVDDGRGGTATDQVTITVSAGVPGDVDGDGRVTILDARLACEAALGLRVLSMAETMRADVADPLGAITLEDAQVIAEMVVGLSPVTVEQLFPSLFRDGGSAFSSPSPTSVPLRVQGWQLRALPGQRGVEFRVLGQGVEAVQVEVFRLDGRKVFASPWTAGSRLVWNLRPTTGTGIPANGVYLVIITAQGADGTLQRSKVHKLILVR